SDVVHTQHGQWAIAWKKTAEDKVSFRYTLYDPAGGGDRAIDRKSFLAAYNFADIAAAPAPLRAIAAEVSGAQAGLVVHLLVRGEALKQIDRYRAGSERLLESGDASLATIPVVRTRVGYFALLPGGRIASVPLAGEPGRAQRSVGLRVVALPALPVGFVYTDLWTDGSLLLVSWEQQRFAEVGAAGLFLASMPSR
ncbi:MAG TPA: hypothetical protein VMW69_06230, partial [Spirochaetia bacterium]|nr:hypothetical protein [Spirochaetia bacterium]